MSCPINATTEIIVPIITSISGIVVGFFTRLLFERCLNKKFKYDELIVNNEISNLKEKLEIYWSIYFKLLVCLTSNIQINKLKNNDVDVGHMIHMGKDIIIKNLEDIVSIISKNIYKMDVDDTLLDLILRFMTHVLAYRCIRQLKISRKTPSEYGFPFPDEFTNEITKRTFLTQKKYVEFVGKRYDPKRIKGNKYLSMSLNEQSKINLEFHKRIEEMQREILVKTKNKEDIIIKHPELLNVNPNDINIERVLNIQLPQKQNDNLLDNALSMCPSISTSPGSSHSLNSLSTTNSETVSIPYLINNISTNTIYTIDMLGRSNSPILNHDNSAIEIAQGININGNISDK